MPEPDDLHVTLRDYYDAQRTAHEREHGQHEKEHAREHEATERAISVAVSAMDKRLDAMNEFRATLTEQQGTLVRRDMLDAYRTDQEKKLDILTESVNELRRGAANMQGRIVGISAAVGVAVILINLGLRLI